MLARARLLPVSGLSCLQVGYSSPCDNSRSAGGHDFNCALVAAKSSRLQLLGAVKEGAIVTEQPQDSQIRLAVLLTSLKAFRAFGASAICFAEINVRVIKGRAEGIRINAKAMRGTLSVSKLHHLPVRA